MIGEPTPRYASTRLERAVRPGPARDRAGRRARVGVLLPVVRHVGAGRRVPALVAARTCTTERHRIGVLPRPRPLLLVGPARDRSADGRAARGGNRRGRRLVVGTGLTGGRAAPRRRSSRRR